MDAELTEDSLVAKAAWCVPGWELPAISFDCGLFHFMNANGVAYAPVITKHRSRRWYLRVGTHQYGPFRSRKAAQRNQETIVTALHHARYDQHKMEKNGDSPDPTVP